MRWSTLRWIAGAVLVMSFAAASSAQPFSRAAEHGDEMDPERFSFADGERRCEVRANGQGLCRRTGSRDWRFRLPVEDGSIYKIYFASVDGELLLAYALSDGEGEWGKFAKLVRGARRPSWTIPLHGLNMTAPILYGDSVIVGALSFLARLNRHDGFAEWRLEHRYAGGGFEQPEVTIRGSQVVSRDSSGKTKTVCFALETGMCEGCVE